MRLTFRRCVSLFFILAILFPLISRVSVFNDVYENDFDLESSASGDALVSALEDDSFVVSLIRGFEETGFGEALDRVIDMVLSSGRYVFLYFYADWCHFCKLEKPIIDELEGAYSRKIVFIRLNEAKNKMALEEFDVAGFPTMFLIYGKTGSSYLYYDFRGFKDKAFLESAITQVIEGDFSVKVQDKSAQCYTSLGGLFSHQSCSFWDCLDACTDKKETNWKDILKELFWTAMGCIDPTVIMNIASCAKAGLQAAGILEEELAGEINDYISCAFSIYDAVKELAKKVPSKLGCAYDIGHFLGDLLGAQQLGECLGECAADPSSYGQICQPGEQRTQCASVPGFISMSECSSDCEWVYVPGSVRSCGVGEECVTTAGGAECRDEDDYDPPDPFLPPPYPPNPPGYDQPDDNYDVSTLWLSASSTFNRIMSDGETKPKIAVLNRGYPLIEDGLVSFLSTLGFNFRLLSISYLEAITPAEYPALVIPSGGLFSLYGSKLVRSNLERYVSSGGTLIVFSQQIGADYSVLPGGELGGFGWMEDMSCQFGSAGMSTYHPILSGQISSGLLDLEIDGFFTQWPKNASILLTRVKNGMPAMILYKYGNGIVIASTLYSDLKASVTRFSGKILLRDLFNWALNARHAQTIPSSAQATASVNFTNTLIYSPSWPMFNRGDLVNIPVNVTNFSSEPVDKVVFAILDPFYRYYYFNVSASLASNETRTFNVAYQTDSNSKKGVYLVLYYLYNGERQVWSGYHGAFLLETSLEALTAFEAVLTLRSPVYVSSGKPALVKNETILLSVPPSETRTLNLTFNPEEVGYYVRYGVWTLSYEIKTLDGFTVKTGVEAYAVSNYQEQPDGWSYKAANISFSITSESELYPIGSNATFTIHFWNRESVPKNITVWWSFPHHYWRYKDAIYGAPGTTTPGLISNLHKTLTVPANGYTNFTYSIPVRKHWWNLDRLWAQFFEGDENSEKYLGMSSRGFYGLVYSAKIVNLEIDEPLKGPSDNVSIFLSVERKVFTDDYLLFVIRVFNNDGVDIWNETVAYYMATGTFSKFFNFTLPEDATPGMYTVTSEVYYGYSLTPLSILLDKFSAYFRVSEFSLKIMFDRPSYRVRETLRMELLLKNFSPSVKSGTLNISIPSLSFSNTTFIELEPHQQKSIDFSLTLPESLVSGLHQVIVVLEEEDRRVTSGFFISESKLRATIGRDSYLRGENIPVGVENVGGVDTSYTYNINVKDVYYNTIYEKSGSDTIEAGNSASQTLLIPEGAVNGTYYLLIQLKDMKTSFVVTKFYIIHIEGLTANIISETDKRIYSILENVEIDTLIENLNGAIENASLKLQITGEEPCVVPHDDLYINKDTKLCPGFYNIKNEGDSYNVIIINASDVVLDCNNAVLNITVGTYDYGWAIANEGHNNVTIKNCIIQNFGGIYLYNVNNSKIINNRISAPDYFPDFEYGIYIEYGENNTIAYNELIDIPGMSLSFANGTKTLYNHLLTGAIELWRSHLNLVMNNTLEDGSIKVERSNNCTVMYNAISLGTITISGTSYYSADYNIVARNTIINGLGGGIELLEAHHNIVAENHVANKTKSGIYLTLSHFNIIVGNIVNSNGKSGIEMESIKWLLGSWWYSPCFNNTIVANTASLNYYGIYANGETKYSVMANNTLTQNSYGIVLDEMGGYVPQYNTIYHNNFLLNTEQVVDENIWTVGKNNFDDGYPNGGNYWSNYIGSDNYNGPYQNVTGSDGIGDTPYVINTATQDNYPFMNPNSWIPFNITEIIEKLNISTPTIEIPGPPQNGNTIWEKVIPINVTNTLNLSTFVGQLGVTGKLYLTSTLYSSTGQIIAWHISTFYITNSDVYLTLETDKQIYKPNENININTEVGNLGNTTKTLTLTLKKDDTTIRNVSFTLNPNQKFTETLTISSSSSFTLEGTVNGFVVKELIRIAGPKMNLTVFTPEIAGRDPFTVTVEIQNTGEVELNLNVSIDSQTRQITIPPNQTRQIQTEMAITQSATLTVRTSGDIEATVTKEITFGENASITIYPEDFYIEGIVEIPYEIRNLGLLETTFTASFVLNSENITKTVYLPVNGNLTGTLTFNLTEGEYILRYSTPFQQGNVTIHVQTPPKIILISLPENMSFQMGQTAEMNVAFKNVGGTMGEIEVKLTVPGLAELTNKTWIEPSMEGDVSFSFEVPEDLEEKHYKAIFEIEGEKHEVKFFVLGAKIAVNASLDKQLYEEGENATLTLRVENLRNMNLTLFSTVTLGDYNAIEYFNLSSYETKELTFSVPVTFDYGKMLYAVYMTSGRALYINALYVYPKPPESAGISIYTDKQVYEIGETATIYVNVTKQGKLTMTAPNLNINTTISPGAHTFSFEIPKLRSGTYPIMYTFEDYSSSYPIDVIGYSARIIGPELDKTTYSNGDTVNLTLIIDVNRSFEGLVKSWIFDPQNNVIGEGSTNHTFTVGENKVKISIILNTHSTGVHAIAYRVYAYGSFIWLASGATYFDAEVFDTTPPQISYVDATNALDENRPIIENEPIAIHAIVTDNVKVEEVALYYRKAGQQTYTKIVMTVCPGCIDTYNVTIPAFQVTTATMEFYINATDGTNYATHPAANPAANPNVIRVNLYPKAVVLSPPTEITENSMKLTWTESLDTDFKNYTIYQSDKAGNLGTPIHTITMKSTISYTVTGLTANTTYYFTVRVYDTGGLYADSNQVSGKTQETQPPALPWIPIAVGLTGAALAIIVAVAAMRKRKGIKKN